MYMCVYTYVYSKELTIGTNTHVCVYMCVYTRVYRFLHSMSDLKATQIKVRRNLIQELIVYSFELNRNAEKATNIINCAESQVIVDHTVQ